LKLSFGTGENGQRYIEQPGSYTCLCGRKGQNPTTLILSGGLWQGNPMFIHPEDMMDAPRQSICWDCGNTVKGGDLPEMHVRRLT